MESFYGGQQGFSFVVKRNPARDNGYFNNLADINNAIATGDLRYGDYAIITNSMNSYTANHGDLYRINTQNQAERVANISHPALATLISEIGEFDDQATGIHTTSINFLTENESKTQETLDVSWKNVLDPQDSSKVIGIEIGIKAPRPVIDISVSQKELNDENPFEIASNTGIVTKENNKPFYYEYGIELPMRSILVPEKTEIDTSNLDSGTLCFITSDIIGKWVLNDFFNTIIGQLSSSNYELVNTGEEVAPGRYNYSGYLFKVPISTFNFTKARIEKSKTVNGTWVFAYQNSPEELSSGEINIANMSQLQSVGSIFNVVPNSFLYLWIGVEGTISQYINSQTPLKDFFKSWQLLERDR